MFLKRVYKQWKLLFWGIMLFIPAQFFFMYKGIENVPFFLYHMFGFAHQPKDSINVILLKTPAGYFNTTQLSGRETEVLMNNILYYNKLNTNNCNDYINESVDRRFKKIFSPLIYHFIATGLQNDSIAVSHYPNWWKRYFGSIAGVGYDSIQVVSSYVYYRPNVVKSDRDSIIFSIHFTR